MKNEIEFEGPVQEISPNPPSPIAKVEEVDEFVEGEAGEFLAEIEAPKPLLPSIPSKCLISLDNTPAEVLSFDMQGITLYFEDEPGRFLDLEEAIFQKLNLDNKNRYLVSQGMNARLVRAQTHPELQATPGMTVTPGKYPVEKRRNTATAKLHVEGVPGIHYAWPLASEVEEFQDLGYKVTSDPRVKTYGGDVGTSRRVVRDGNVEHVLMEIPDPSFQSQLKQNSDASRKRMKGAEEATKLDILRSGGLPLDEKSRVAGNFGPITPEGPVA
jgi:hypothetical protein